MRRLIAVVALITALSGCRRDDKIKLEKTDESTPELSSIAYAGDPKTAIQLLRGFYGVESNSWRWTMGSFAVTLKPPTGSAQKGARAFLKFSIPESVTQHVGKTTLSLSVKSTPVKSESYAAPGEYLFTADVPPTLLQSDATTLSFSMDKFLTAGMVEPRELGLVFLSCGLEAK